jgi:hypothetical protein
MAGTFGFFAGVGLLRTFASGRAQVLLVLICLAPLHHLLEKLLRVDQRAAVEFPGRLLLHALEKISHLVLTESLAFLRLAAQLPAEAA